MWQSFERLTGISEESSMGCDDEDSDSEQPDAGDACPFAIQMPTLMIISMVPPLSLLVCLPMVLHVPQMHLLSRQ
jgi:hypothetical protein